MSFIEEFFGGPVDDFLVRELTDPGSPEFEGRCHCERCQRARSIALMAMTGLRPDGPVEADGLRAYLEEGGSS